MNFKTWISCACAIAVGGCTAPVVEAPTTVAAVAPTLVPVVAATPRPSPTKSLFIGAKPTPFPTAKPKPTVAPFKTKPAKGFSESQRRKIFYDLVNCEDRAREEADEKFSPYDESTNNLDENDRLTEKFKAEVIADYKLSEAQVDAIQGEGLDNQWPPLTPLKSPYAD